MLHQLHVLRQASHRRAALAVERDGEEFAVAAGRDEGAEAGVLEEAEAGERSRRGGGARAKDRDAFSCALREGAERRFAVDLPNN